MKMRAYILCTPGTVRAAVHSDWGLVHKKGFGVLWCMYCNSGLDEVQSFFHLSWVHGLLVAWKVCLELELIFFALSLTCSACFFVC